MTWITNRLIVLGLACICAVGLSNPLTCQGESAAPSVKGNAATLESIAAEGEGSAVQLVLKLSAPTTYTSYKTVSPLRLVIDLSQTRPGTAPALLPVNGGNFTSVAMKSYDTEAGPLARLEIGLVQDVEPLLTVSKERPGELRLSFPTFVAPPAPAAIQAVPPAPVNEEVKGAAVPPAAAPVDSKSRILTAVSSKNGSILLKIEGGVGEFKAFRLSKPERYVVDLFGVRNGMNERLLPINVAGIASARLGLYPDKLRVVFDGVNGNFPELRPAQSAEGLMLSVGGAAEGSPAPVVKATAPAKEDGKPVAPAAPAAPQQPAAVEKQTPAATAPSAEKTIARSDAPSVESIDFQVMDGTSRIAVKVVGPVTAEPLSRTAGAISLTLKNATLPRHLQRSLDTAKFTSPVLRITPSTVKTKKGADTRIRIALRSPASCVLSRESDVVMVDCKAVGKPAVDAAELQELQPQVSPRVARPATGSASELDSTLIAHAEPATRPLDGAKTYKGRKVTLEFADAEVRKIFQLLSEVSNKNFVLGDDVTGAISIKLVNVPWDQALDIILDTKGLDKREEGNIIIIKGKGKFKSQAEEEQEVKKALTRSLELKTETFSVNYADTAGISAQFASLKSDRGTITQDVRTNKVIVKDIPQALDDMRRLLQQLDVPEKQVMIEARIVEATSTFTRNLGVNWGIHYRDAAASFLGINSLDTGFGGLTSAPPTSGVGSTAGGAMGISFGTLASDVKLDLRLNAAASAGLIKIVSTPKVATLNNKTAKITQGQQIPYTSSTSDKVETKFIEAALSLEVTPHINANGTIGMKIDAKNDAPGAGGNPPPINKKQATTEMLLRDGETTVIGGIFVDSDTESDDGVPFLMDIPLFGKLFKTNNKSKTKTELLIFITPRILGTI